MMNCKIVNSNLIAYLDNELNLDKRIQFDAHISACPTCRSLLAKMEMTYRLIDDEKDEFTHNHFLGAKIWNKINSPKSKSMVPIIPLKRVSIAYIVAAGLILGVSLGTLFSNYVFKTDSDTPEQTWTQLADEYFPAEYYEPFDDIANSSN